MNWYRTQKIAKKKKDAAGILFVCCGEILLGLRSNNVSNSNTWAVPGGRTKKSDGNFWETAKRETTEEIGLMPDDFTKTKKIKNVNRKTGRKFVTFVLEVPEEFKNKIVSSFSPNAEFDDLQWFPLHDLPSNMHKKTLRVINSYIDN